MCVPVTDSVSMLFKCDMSALFHLNVALTKLISDIGQTVRTGQVTTNVQMRYRGFGDVGEQAHSYRKLSKRNINLR